MNIYIHAFTAACPQNNRRVRYVLRLASVEMVLVEDLRAFTAALGSGYHESIADALYERFGGTQTLYAYHHGTDIETIRPMPRRVSVGECCRPWESRCAYCR